MEEKNVKETKVDKDMEKLVKMRDLLLESAYALDEVIELGKKEQEGEDVTSRGEATIGKLIFKFMELQTLMEQ